MAIDVPPSITRPAVDVDATRAFAVLRALHEEENPFNSREPGPSGELGPYQFKKSTWEGYTTLPFTPRYVCDELNSEAVALKHLRWIEQQLRRHGLVESVFNIAVAWKGGIEHACHQDKYATLAELMYALRVEALVREETAK